VNVRTRVVYIMAVGHSGSTILDIALGNHPRIESVGEVAKLHRFGWSGDPIRRCACGEKHADCPYWNGVRKLWTAGFGDSGVQEYAALQRRFDLSRRRWPRVVAEARAGSAAFRRYVDMTAGLFDCIAEWSGKPVVVDSSKTPIRAYALLQAAGIDVTLVHLIRDGRGVVWAHSRPRKQDVAGGVPEDRDRSPAWRQSADWALTNLECEWVCRVAGAERSLRMVYERFVREPGPVLAGLGALLGEDLLPLGESLAQGLDLEIGHNSYGNKLRMQRRVVLAPSDAWRQLPARDEATFWRVAGWMARRYGYER
jgi:hypothetical protein